jgi:5-methyltetrahydrofolate--homocysteine methyltransferase
VRDDYTETRQDYYDGLEDKRLHAFDEAMRRRKVIDFTAQPPAPAPKAGLGAHKAPPCAIVEVLPYIDWGPFFQTWELRGRYPNNRYPKIFNDEKVGAEAKKLYDDAQRMIATIVQDGSMWLAGAMGFYACNQSDDGEDVVLFADAGRAREAGRLHMLRQQQHKENDDPMLSLADFVAPQGHADHVGMFAVACHGCDALAAKFEAAHDDYSKILAQALADRFVEAYAEKLHHDIRKEHWGYAYAEELAHEDLLKIKYDGIRPAPGYPSQPEHSEKKQLWDLLDAEKLAGMKLTDSYSMTPASAVSAIVFAHPASEYFAVGSVNKDQVLSYAKRKGVSVDEIERWLAPVLAYER